MSAARGEAVLRRDAVVANDPLLNPAEAGLYLGISAYSVRKMARERKLPAIRLGKHWRFRSSALTSWMEAQERPAR